MFKKAFKSITVSLVALLLLGFALFFVGCSNKQDTSHSANSIPKSDVFQDTVDYLVANGQKFPQDGKYIYETIILGDETNMELVVSLDYNEATSELAVNLSSQGDYGFSFGVILPKLEDYSKVEHKLEGFVLKGENVLFSTNITLPATKYVDMNTTTTLPEFTTITTGTPTDTEKQEAHVALSTVIAKSFTAFDEFYANTIKKDSKYIGATYKYFYLPVIK